MLFAFMLTPVALAMLVLLAIERRPLPGRG
jgi:hypothetical protein